MLKMTTSTANGADCALNASALKVTTSTTNGTDCALNASALKMTTSTVNGTDCALNAGTLSVNNGFTGTLTSTATFSDEAQTREIDFIYDHNGMRTAKIVSENGRVEMTEYTSMASSSPI